MKKSILVILMTAVFMISLCACGESSTSSYSGSSNDYDDPKPGQSFSDYVKEEDPELYDDMQDTYNKNTGAGSSYSSSHSSSHSSSSSNDDYDYDKGFGYEAPKPGQSFSDYVKEQDPDLYNDMQDILNSLE